MSLLLTGSGGAGVSALALLAGGDMPDPILDWDFTRSRSAPPWSTFTRSSTKNIWRGGVLTNIGVDVFPADEDPITQASKGMLREGSATNLCLRSEAFDNAAYGKATNVTVSANAVAAPDGATTGDKIIEADAGTGSQAQRLSQGITVVNATAYCWSVFVKAAERSVVKLEMGFTGSPRVTFNLSSGTVQNSTGSPTASGIQSCGNGWYRIWIVATATSSASLGFYVMLGNSASGEAGNYTGDGVSGAYAWGAQLESGLVPTSYIGTTSATVTRSAEVFTRTLGSEFNASAFSLGVEFSKDVVPATTNNFVCDLDDASASNRVSISLSSGSVTADVLTGGVQQASGAGVAYVAGTIGKAEWGVAANDAAYAYNGSVSATDVSVTVPAVTILSIGSRDNTNAAFMGHLRRIYLRNYRRNSNDMPGDTAA